MIVLINLSFIGLITLDFLINRYVCSPVFLFSTLWMLICNLASMQLFGLSFNFENTINIFFVGVISFSIGAIFIELLSTKKPRFTQKEIIRDNTVKLNFTFLNLLLALVIIGTVGQLFLSVRALMRGTSYLDIHSNLLGYNVSSDEGESSFFQIFNSYFCGPARFVLLPVAMICWIKKIKKRFSFLTFLCFLISIIASGGRIGIIYAIVQGIAVGLFYRIKITRKIRRRLFFCILICAIGLFFLTVLRSNGVLRTAYFYFAIPAGLFQKYSQVINNANFCSYGTAFLYPVFFVLNSVLSIFGIHSDFLTNLIYYVGYPQDVWVGSLAPNTSFNAFASLFYYFYMDGRVFGVIFESCLFGILSGFIFKKAIRERNENFFLWYLLIIQSIVGSFMIWQLGSTKLWVTFFMLAIAQISFKHEPIRIKKRNTFSLF